MIQTQSLWRSRLGSIVATAVILFCAGAALGQSTTLDFPTPVTSNEINGTILARDIGDARLTHHFYLLSGTTGDLNLSVQYSNLNGDIDLFTASDMRPLAQVSLVAGDNLISVDRTVFMRLHEKLVLRIEARSANDDPGRYRIRFSGTFEALADNGDTPAAPTVTARSTPGKGRRVTSAGAIIDEPMAKVEPAKPPVTPTPSRAAGSKPTRTTTNTPAKTAGTTAAGSSATKRTRTPARRTAANKPVITPAKTIDQPARDTSAGDKPATTPGKRGATPTRTATRPVRPAPAADPMANARLVVDTRDGMRREHFMRDVRRFTVEKGILMVVLKDGSVEQEPMSNVLKVTIEP